MELPLAWSLLLVVTGVWTPVVWAQFMRRVARDPRSRHDDGSRTPFFTVHVVLVGVSVTLGLLVLLLGVLTLV